MNNVLIIDNYDSFTFNLVHAVEEITGSKAAIKKNDLLTINEVERFDHIILSPGPGLPEEAGLLKSIIETYHSTKKIFGVCLGLQAIAEVYGCKLKNLKQVYHGIKSEITITKTSKLYNGLPQKIEAGRYHSWVVDKETISDDLIVTARGEFGEIMAAQHNEDKVYGVQFHPELKSRPLAPHPLFVSLVEAAARCANLAYRYAA